MKKLIWTEAYRPFMMGGDVNQPIGTMVELDTPIDLGKGAVVHVVASPNGTIHIVESKTGAFVGTSLAQVKKDIKEADEDVIKQQIKDSRKRRKEVEVMSNEDFWSYFRS